MTRQCVICGAKNPYALRDYPLFGADEGRTEAHAVVCSKYIRAVQRSDTQAGECARVLQEMWVIHLGLQEEI